MNVTLTNRYGDRMTLTDLRETARIDCFIARDTDLEWEEGMKRYTAFLDRAAELEDATDAALAAINTDDVHLTLRERLAFRARRFYPTAFALTLIEFYTADPAEFAAFEVLGDRLSAPRDDRAFRARTAEYAAGHGRTRED